VVLRGKAIAQRIKGTLGISHMGKDMSIDGDTNLQTVSLSVYLQDLVFISLT